MTSEYKVVITISHRSISLEYNLRGAGDGLEPFGKGKWPAPLAFYYSGDGFVIGEEAVTAAQLGNSNAYTDYFEIIRTDRRFTLGGHSYPVSQLLLRGVEEYFQYFFREVWCGNLGELEANRSEMPLILVYDADIENNEKVVLAQAFRDWGYGNLKIVSYSDIISNYLNRNAILPYTLVAWSDGSDMHFSLYKQGGSGPMSSRLLPDKLGKDPRIDLICDLIWKRDLVYQVFGLTYEQELPRLRKAAMAFLRSNEAEIDGELILSDGFSYTYYLNRYNINSLSYEYRESEALDRELRHFLEDNGITDKKKVALLLRGDASGNDYFRGQLAPGFGAVEEVDKDMRQEVKKLILNISFDEDPVATVGSGRRAGIASGPRIKDGAPEKGHEEEKSGNQNVTTNAKEALASPVVAESGDIRRKKRELRTKFAEAKGKSNVGKNLEAKQLLNECRTMAAEIMPSMLTDIDLQLEEVEKKLKTNPGHTPRPNPLPKPEPAPRPKPKTGPRPDREPMKAKPKAEEGEELIAQGKLKEAREWYRTHGKNAKATLLGDIIRASRGLKQRRDSLDSYRKEKDKVKTQRVIKELQDYVDMCAKAGVPCPEEIKLLGEYKKIIR